MDGTAATNIPDFDLPASTGQNLSLGSFVDKVPLAIVFLTDLEADRALLETLDDALPQFGKQRSQLLVVVPIAVDDLRRFIEDNDITLPVLADAAGTMARDFGTHDEEGAPQRMAFVATAEGRMVTRLDEVTEADVVERLLTEVGDLELGGDIEPAADDG